jgi:hypothetical protein
MTCLCIICYPCTIKPINTFVEFLVFLRLPAMAQDEPTSFHVESLNNFPYDCYDYFPNYNYTPLLVVSRPQTTRGAVIKLALDKPNTKKTITGGAFNVSHWTVSGFQLLTGDNTSPVWSPDLVDPRNLTWNVVMLHEEHTVPQALSQPRYVASHFNNFPTSNSVTVDTAQHPSIKSLSLQFAGGELHRNPTQLTITTKRNLRTQVLKYSPKERGLKTLFYLDVSFNANYM